jgi:hypothetical protein
MMFLEKRGGGCCGGRWREGAEDDDGAVAGALMGVPAGRRVGDGLRTGDSPSSGSGLSSDEMLLRRGADAGGGRCW